MLAFGLAPPYRSKLRSSTFENKYANHFTTKAIFSKRNWQHGKPLNKKGRVKIVTQANCIFCVTVAVHCGIVSGRLHNTCKHIYNASMISPMLNTEAPIKSPSEPPISANICDLCKINIAK